MCLVGGTQRPIVSRQNLTANHYRYPSTLVYFTLSHLVLVGSTHALHPCSPLSYPTSFRILLFSVALCLPLLIASYPLPLLSDPIINIYLESFSPGLKQSLVSRQILTANRSRPMMYQDHCSLPLTARAQEELPYSSRVAIVVNQRSGKNLTGNISATSMLWLRTSLADYAFNAYQVIGIKLAPGAYPGRERTFPLTTKAARGKMSGKNLTAN